MTSVPRDLCLQVCMYTMADTEKRTPNFSKYEVNVLLELVRANASVIENKQTDGCSLKGKQAMWSHIETQFNSTPGVTMRSSGRLKTCYDNLKRRLRKDLAEEKVNTYKTGGGTPIPKKNHDPKLLEIVGTSLEPLKNTFDSDGTYNIIVDVVDRGEVECSDANILEVDSSQQHAPLTDISLPSTSNGPAIVKPVPMTPHISENNQMARSQAVSCASGEAKTITSTPCKWSRRRMPAKPRPSGSGTIIESVCRKRVDVLEEQLKMMKEEHKCELKIKRLKILTLREKLKYWRNKNKEN